MTARTLLLAVLLLAGCGGGAQNPSGFDAEHSNMTVAEGRAFTDFPLFYLGDEFDGHRLTAMNRRLSPAPVPPRQTNYVSFIYGTCEPMSDTGCPPPLEVQVWPICERNPSLYSATPDPDGPGPAEAEPFPSVGVTIRGVPGAFYRGASNLEVYAGHVTIVIFASEREQLRRAAQALRPLNDSAEVGADGSFPQPDRQILREGCTS